MSEDCVWVRDADVAGEGEVESAAHAIAVNGGANGSRELIDGEHQTLAHEREVEGVGMERGDFIEVGTGGEEVVVARDDERLRIFREFLDGFRECAHTGA